MQWDGNKITEHNRSAIDAGEERIEVKKRMANGQLRRWTTAIKRTYSFSYTAVPSKTSKTVDGQWGGEDMKDFYDTSSDFTLTIHHGDGSVETLTAVITSLTYDITKRSPVSDLWDMSIEIEEV
jgi:hypothetical protein